MNRVKGQPDMGWVRAAFVGGGKFLIPVMAFAGLTAVLHKRGTSFSLEGFSLNVGLLAVAVAIAIAYRLLNAGVWAIVLEVLGQEIRRWKAMRIWLLSESMRWWPGGVWSYASRAAIGVKAGLSVTVVTLSLPVELALTIGAWVACALTGVLLAGDPQAWFSRLPVPPEWRTHATVAPLLALVLVPMLLLLVRKSERVRCWRERFRRLRGATFESAAAAKGLGVYYALCLFNGLGLFLVLRSLSPDSAKLWQVIAANALAWLVGFVTFIAPGGLGVREATLAFLLAPWMPVEVAIVGGLLWRLVSIATEQLILFGILVRTRRDEERAPQAELIPSKRVERP